MFLTTQTHTLAQVQPCGHPQGAVAQVAQKTPHGVVVTAHVASMETTQQQSFRLVPCTCQRCFCKVQVYMAWQHVQCRVQSTELEGELD